MTEVSLTENSLEILSVINDMHYLSRLSTGNLNLTVEYTIIDKLMLGLTNVGNLRGTILLKALINLPDQVLHSSICVPRVICLSERELCGSSKVSSHLYIHRYSSSYSFIEIHALISIERELMVLEEV